MTDDETLRTGDSLRESSAPRATVVDNSGGAYPMEDWEATCFASEGRATRPLAASGPKPGTATARRWLSAWLP